MAGSPAHTVEVDRRSFIEAAAVFSLIAPIAAEAAEPEHAARIESLIARMTLEEKAGQLTLMPDVSRAGALAGANPQQVSERDDLLGQIRACQVGGVFNGVGAAGARALQRIAMEETRLRIPLIFGADIIHGYKTVFPIPLGEAASFEPDLAESAAPAREGSARSLRKSVPIHSIRGEKEARLGRLQRALLHAKPRVARLCS